MSDAIFARQPTQGTWGILLSGLVEEFLLGTQNEVCKIVQLFLGIEVYERKVETLWTLPEGRWNREIGFGMIRCKRMSLDSAIHQTQPVNSGY
ncbi:hypothetical protein CC1G_14782 [Coprinopsis cinerea okayama7|uniref:Uncharacterized protein n=1 Tax=Coprinopsis cinerea (strain Okayama-7 / 130 / ATCC MYA-4618 / FGSC 9003) TaxID=240176 RepID=D6RNU2_COPC7|nr:hypothetical protein CC1G_14782 [Coprinopsis cinerea okayama7\|eukprot:XP_002910804.1 hypothetical protein CC1G_14782 [Coprinopsis cinerea okayama7\